MFPEFLLARRGGLGLMAVVGTLVLASCDGVTGERFEPVRYRLTNRLVYAAEPVRTKNELV